MGVLIVLQDMLLEGLREQGLKISATFVDGTFMRAMRGAIKWAKRKSAKRAKSWRSWIKL
jgi:hypothetical protein